MLKLVIKLGKSKFRKIETEWFVKLRARDSIVSGFAFKVKAF